MLATLGSLDSQDRLDHPVKLDNVAFKDPEVQMVIPDLVVRWGRLDRLANLVSRALLGMLVLQDCRDLKVQLVHLDNKARVEVKDSQVIQDLLDNQEIMEYRDHPAHLDLVALLDLRVLKDPKAHQVVEASLVHVDCLEVLV